MAPVMFVFWAIGQTIAALVRIFKFDITCSSVKKKNRLMPQIAVSVDMLDTGIDIVTFAIAIIFLSEYTHSNQSRH